MKRLGYGIPNKKLVWLINVKQISKSDELPDDLRERDDDAVSLKHSLTGISWLLSLLTGQPVNYQLLDDKGFFFVTDLV